MLWDDVRRLAELRLESAGGAPQHFLGAIVLQQQLSQAGELSERTVIDGQQRLTTLQIVLDATSAVVAALGHNRLARQLDALTTNPEDYCTHAEDRFKVWPTNRDRAAYNEVMAAKPPVDYASLANKASLVVRAHEYFATEVEGWLLADGEESSAERAEQLVLSLRGGLQIVVIDLRPDENSQEIFETLNARGTPLTAADLIKNFVFQRLALEHAEAAEAAYHDYWSLFETAFWEQEISVGRYATPRSSLFLNQWLGARTGEEVSPRMTFSRFKHYVEHEMAQPMSALLPTLREQATQYQRWIVQAAEPGANLSAVELFVYRTQVAELEFVKPILLWLHDPAAPVPLASVNDVVSAVESWVMRRALLRLSTGDLGRVVADLIRSCRPLDPATLGARVSEFLARQDSASTYWPGDDSVRQELRLSPVYRRYKRGRLRMYLETIEDHDRGYAGTKPSKTGSRVVRGALDIEHVLPQNWRANWPVVGLAEEIRRDAHVHRLGNLTLLSGSLNSALSNGTWLGENGKRAQIDKHDVILLNRWIRVHGASGWDEDIIDARAEIMIDALLDTWRVPAGHIGQPRDDSSMSAQSVELKDLVAAGLLADGDILRVRQGSHPGVSAVLLPDGRVRVGDAVFDTPSGAGRHVLGGQATNGWYFWGLDDGRRLHDVREAFLQSLTR